MNAIITLDVKKLASPYYATWDQVYDPFLDECQLATSQEEIRRKSIDERRKAAQYKRKAAQERRIALESEKLRKRLYVEELNRRCSEIHEQARKQRLEYLESLTKEVIIRNGYLIRNGCVEGRSWQPNP